MDLLYLHVSYKNPVLSTTRYRALICGHLQLVGPYKKESLLQEDKSSVFIT